MTGHIYTEGQARTFCAIAIERGRCAELLNTLASGGAVSIDAATIPPDGLPIWLRLAFLSAEQVAWLASDGKEGYP